MKKNAFTLIELLAIIVILAIIAVITVPIILNIIENSRKGAATDSAYGYKDSVSKLYVTKLSESQNSSLELEGTYTVTDGVLTGTGINEKVPVSGTIPSSGSLTYENGLFKNGCLTIGDYAVTFNIDGTTSTEKGECNVIPTIATCPGCKFIFTTSDLIIGTSDMPSSATDVYTDWTSGENSHPYFLGLIESTTTPGKIGRAFVCGVKNDTPFCLEGYDTSKWSDGTNAGVLNTIYPSCYASASNFYAYCVGSSVSANAEDDGTVGVYDAYGRCDVGNGGTLRCNVESCLNCVTVVDARDILKS